MVSSNQENRVYLKEAQTLLAVLFSNILSKIISQFFSLLPSLVKNFHGPPVPTLSFMTQQRAFWQLIATFSSWYAFPC